MAGIVGIAGPSVGITPCKTISAMYDLMTHRPQFVRDRPFRDDHICAGRCHPGIINRISQPASRSGVHLWFTGELYNKESFGDADADETTLLLAAHQAGGLVDFLHDADGIFAGALYDSNRKSVLLFTDRYGLRYLYWTKHGSSLVWAEEAKAFLALPDHTPAIDRESLDDFVNRGFIRGDRSWFGGVSLLSPATVLSFDCLTGSLSRTRYYDWHAIKPPPEKIDLREYAVEWGARLKKSVHQRLSGDKRVGLFLSGGLDSRSLLAATPSDYPMDAVTFGLKGCDEIRVASRVASAKSAHHHVVELRPDNWFFPRLQGVWQSDGELPLPDMHGMEFADEVATLFPISFNGLGGAVQSGLIFDSRLGPPPEPDYPLGEVGRRSARRGVLLEEPCIHARLPLYANDLIDLTLSLPVDLRKNGYFYKKALALNFPELFSRIPYQRSGVPVSVPSPWYELLSLKTRCKRKCSSLLSRKLPFVRNTAVYADYPSWFRRNPVRDFVTSLFSGDALLHQFVPKETVLGAWNALLAKGVGTTQVGRFVTIELWLQQVYNSKYRR
jgi:asparagine synthase (glutamine-hydrolysing)